MNLSDFESIDASNLLIVIVDPQPSILSATLSHEKVLNNILLLIRSAKEFEIPIIITEQYPKGLGNISEKIAELIDKATPIVEKLEFDCFENEKFTETIHSFPSRKYVVIFGVEAHICLFQTVLGAIKNDYIPIIISDAISSRKESDYQTALNCYKSLNILSFSTEMLIYFLLKKAGTQKFKYLLKYLK